MNAAGVVKLGVLFEQCCWVVLITLGVADFSNAIRVDRNAPTVSGAVGVIYWQVSENSRNVDDMD